jgi:L-lactate dehydrogenase
MKIGIIGAGAVGAACAMATVMRGCAGELVLVNRSRGRAKGMVTDMGYGAPLSFTTRVTDGDYSDLEHIPPASNRGGFPKVCG